MTEQETLYTIALTRALNSSLQTQHLLIDELGSATAIYENRLNIQDVLPDAHPHLVEALAGMDAHLAIAEEEIQFAQNSHIQCLGLNDEDYPTRLRDCTDAPLILYYRGNAELNARHVLAIVGTRQITEYGKDICQRFIQELKEFCPEALIISGLAYGVDINAHRAALKNGMSTIGVLAHGLDQIYPRAHRNTAIEMLSQGGLLTEFMSHTAIDKRYFVQRNRIVAGMSDATVVVESASKGGSLITAEIAEGYHRDVFAFPGRVKDPYSMGCNELIRSNRAALLMSAEDFVQAMGWENAALRNKKLEEGIQQELFPNLTEDETKIVNALQKASTDGRHINLLNTDTGIPIGLLSSLLFGLEMRGVVKMMCGGRYRLL